MASRNVRLGAVGDSCSSSEESSEYKCELNHADIAMDASQGKIKTYFKKKATSSHNQRTIKQFFRKASTVKTTRQVCKTTQTKFVKKTILVISRESAASDANDKHRLASQIVGVPDFLPESEKAVVEQSKAAAGSQPQPSKYMFPMSHGIRLHRLNRLPSGYSSLSSMSESPSVSSSSEAGMDSQETQAFDLVPTPPSPEPKAAKVSRV